MTLDLIPDVTVTRENRLQYIQLVSPYHLSKQIKLQSEAFFEGWSIQNGLTWDLWELLFLTATSE
jgi:hypothetical protein